MENIKEQYEGLLQAKEKSYRRAYIVSIILLTVFSVYCLLTLMAIIPLNGPSVGFIILPILFLLSTIFSKILLENTRKLRDTAKNMATENPSLQKDLIKQKRSSLIAIIVVVIVFILLTLF